MLESSAIFHQSGGKKRFSLFFSLLAGNFDHADRFAATAFTTTQLLDFNRISVSLNSADISVTCASWAWVFREGD
jgi:hypothetical protein